MASQYQHRQFFRRLPNALLARYFDSRDVSLDVDFGELTETQVTPSSNKTWVTSARAIR